VILMPTSDWLIGACVRAVQHRRSCASCGGGPPWGDSDVCAGCDVALTGFVIARRNEAAMKRVREKVQRIARAQERRDAWPQVG